MRRKTLHMGGYEWNILLPDGQADCAVYLPMHGTAEEIWRMVPGCRAALVSVSGFDWNRDLSPWPAKAVFGDEDFTGGADTFLGALLGMIPHIEREAGIQPVWRGIAGYSLAGLFAAYAVYRCDAFARAASVSGSMWYDGWLDFARQNPFAAPVDRAYFSVGAKEKKTRNARMAAVEDCTRAMNDLFRDRGADSLFELNPGNHFVDADARMARAVRFLSGAAGE